MACRKPMCFLLVALLVLVTVDWTSARVLADGADEHDLGPSDEIKLSTCPLLPSMELDMCDLDSEAVEGIDNLGASVPQGAMCMLDPLNGDVRVFECVESSWLDTAKQRRQTDIQHPKEKRFIGLVIFLVFAVRAIVCAFLCRKKSNRSPSITCPSISTTFYAGPKSTRAKVSWGSASAWDPENGGIRSWRSSGVKPNTYQREGRHSVTYMTKDNDGKTATCTRKFEVKVRRCSTSNLSLKNGKAKCSDRDLYGSQCTYTCDPGYQLNKYRGSSTCNKDGSWSFKPSCSKISCGRPRNVPKGSWSCDSHLYGAKCYLTCTGSGYKPKGSTAITCQSNKIWTPAGTCIDIQPPDIQCKKTISVYAGPQKSSVNVSWSMPKVSDNSGAKVSISSAPPSGSAFDPYSQDNNVVFTAQDQAGNKGVCVMAVDVQVRKCNASLNAPDFAGISCSHHNVYGSVCTVSCNQGYQIEGDAIRTCQENGIWSGRQPRCIPRQCPSLPSVPHGMFDCQNGQAYQDTCALVCDKGYRSISPFSITCNINIQWTQAGACEDVEAPQFPSGCPPDMEYSAARLGESTYVIYSLPNATDNSGESVVVKGEPNSGSVFDLGATNVTITAQDPVGNMAKCQFTITVRNSSCAFPLLGGDKKLLRYDCPERFLYGAACSLTCSDRNPVQGPTTIRCDRVSEKDPLEWTWEGNVAPYCMSDVCPKLREPKNGALVCGSLNGDAGEQCLLMCEENYMYPTSAPEVYNCFKSRGIWSHGGYVPDCLVKRRARRAIVKPSFYYYSSDCHVNNTEIKEKFLEALKASTFKDACSGNQICTVSDVKISCSSSSRKKRQVKQGLATLEVSVEIEIGAYEDKGTDSETRFFYDTLADSINEALMLEAETGLFNIPEAGQFDGYGYGTMGFQCNPGERFNTPKMFCAGCGEGYHYHNATESCVPCHKGTYQDQEVSFSCVPCSSGMTTRDLRAMSVDQCVEMCRPGEISPTGIKPCSPCERGSYQSNFGMTSCDICPFGMSTESAGSSSSSECLVYNIRLEQEMNHPRINLTFPNPITSMTWMMWVHSVSSIPDLTLTFSLVTDDETKDAYFTIGDLHMVVKTVTSDQAKTIRQWFHIAILFDGGMVTLYVNGKEKEQLRNSKISQQQNDMFSFTPSDNIKSIVVSGVQMSASALTPAEIRDFSTSCSKMVDTNMLMVKAVDTTLVTPSTCDDVDDCVGLPCGDHGKCVDGLHHFTCICDDPWSGDGCQTAPDFCFGNECTENSQCINLPEEKNYKCACPDGYTGGLCLDKIVNGQWSMWEEWGACSVTCGSGKRSRTRECNNPLPGPGGEECPGDAMEFKECIKDPCSVDGRWGDWSAWTCQVTCGSGRAVRTRQCNNPPPSNGGLTCFRGPRNSYKTCTMDECSVDGQFGPWSDWSQCSVTCGGGTASRRRFCDSPAPSQGGTECDSSQAVESRMCNTQKCPECTTLEPKDGYKSINCDFDQLTAMLTCNITCKLGLMLIPADVNEFVCGRLTNYTWSHQTIDNPTGILPACTEVKLPSSQKTVINIGYDNIDCNNPPPTVELKNSINDNLEQSISCKGSGDCASDIKATLSCGKRKRATGSVKAVVSMEIIQPDKHPQYLSELSEEEIEAQMNRAYIIEEMTMELLNQSKEIFQVKVGGIEYNGEVTGGRVELQCQDGSGMIDGVCVDCPAGSYSAGNGSCPQCEKGFYQDQIRSTSCLPCPEGLTTSGMGSASRNDCQADPPEYKDLFAWTFDDEEEINSISESDKSPEASNDNQGEIKLVIIVICVTIVLALLLTVIAVYGRGCRRHEEQQAFQHLNPVFSTEVCEAIYDPCSSGEMPKDSDKEWLNVYDVIGENAAGKP